MVILKVLALFVSTWTVLAATILVYWFTSTGELLSASCSLLVATVSFALVRWSIKLLRTKKGN
jgi:hypothetical protein